MSLFEAERTELYARIKELEKIEAKYNYIHGAAVHNLMQEVKIKRELIVGLLAIVAQSPNDDDWRGRIVRDARSHLAGDGRG